MAVEEKIMAVEKELLKHEKKLKKEEDILNLLKEQFNTSKLLIKLEFGEFFPEDVKEFIYTIDSIVSNHSGRTFMILGAHPDDEYSYELDVAKGMEMYKFVINCMDKEITNNEKLLLINHMDCIEKIALCEQRRYNINNEISSCKKWLKNHR